MEKFKALIVDDERPGRENLKAILSEYFPEISVVGMADNGTKAKKLIEELNPNIIFLDVELGVDNGLDFLKSLDNTNFETIFVTAYEEYAVKAFRTKAIDYILKPIDIDDLKDAIQKVKSKLSQNVGFADQPITSDELNANDNRNDVFIKVNTQDGSELISTEDIIYLQSINYYTNIVLKDKREIISTKTLKEHQKQLSKTDFFRIHNSYIINLRYLKGVISKESFYAKLINDVQISISRRRKDEFLAFLNNKTKIITEF